MATKAKCTFLSYLHANNTHIGKLDWFFYTMFVLLKWNSYSTSIVTNHKLTWFMNQQNMNRRNKHK